MTLRGYRFEHPREEDRVITVGGWSYLWAGLFGCLYVATRGSRMGLVAKALAIDLAYLLLFAAVVAGSFVLPALYQVALVGLSAPVLLFLHGAAMIRLVRDSYRRRGWWVQRA
jgi:hypothetical protein